MNRRISPSRSAFLFVSVLALLCALHLAAHEVGPEEPDGPHNLHELLHTWGWEPGSLLGLLLSAGAYAWGLWHLWKTAGVGHGIRRWEAACFAAGWVTLFIALISPLHPWGQMLFSAHMAQHELLMLVAAPLLVLGRPMIPFLRALPIGWASSLARFSNTRIWHTAWAAITNPFSAWLIGAVVLWAWHSPALFQATLRNEWIHAAQHLSFLLSALLFWWAILHGRPTDSSYGVAVLYMFTTAVHSGLLGALLTFARSPWYPAYAERTASWGLTALDDQQLGGLIMWVPACLVYIAAGLALFARWLRQSERRALKLQHRWIESSPASLAPQETP